MEAEKAKDARSAEVAVREPVEGARGGSPVREPVEAPSTTMSSNSAEVVSPTAAISGATY